MMNIAMNPIANNIGVLKRDASTPHRADPVEDLHAGRDGDQHRRQREAGLGDRAPSRP